MDIFEVLDTPDSAGARAADRMAEAIATAAHERGRCAVAFSGGSTPVPMFDHLAKADVPWDDVHVFQVDERVAPDASPERNWTAIREHLLSTVRIPAVNLHLMPVGLPNLPDAADRYAESLREVCGAPPILDVVHLGLGPEGHSASLFAGDRALSVNDADVAATNLVAGFERLTLTVPTLRRARTMLWLITGAEKASALRQLVEGADIPAARLARDDAVIFADKPAAALLNR